MTEPKSSVLTLNDAAEQLGVHYMTAYRYVRTGRLTATKHKGQWWVEPAELKAVANAGSATQAKTRSGGISYDMYCERLRGRLVEADEQGGWTIINDALTAGASPGDVHLKIISPAMEWIGSEWEHGRITVAAEHQASSTVMRLIGRMTSMFRHPGRRRATAVVGAVTGDVHTIPTAMLSDLLTDAGYRVIDLGANTPVESFVEVASGIDGVTILGLTMTTEAAADAMIESVHALRRDLPDVGLFVGGRAAHVLPDDLPIDGSAATGDDAIKLFDEFLAAS